MTDVLAKEDVNTGRQIEFDYMKGIFMLFIFLIHAYQATWSDMNLPVNCIYAFATMSGVAIYIFVMGFGVSYSEKATPSDLVKRGVRMLILQYLTNLLYVISLLIPYPFVRGTLTPDGAEIFELLLYVYIRYVNVFFITGVIYLVLALLKKFRVPIFVYPILAIVTALAAPMVYGTSVDAPVLGFIMKLLIGEDVFVSFTPLYFLPYALIGVAVGKFYRRIKDKALFYRKIIPVCLVIIIAWWVSVFIRLRPPAEFMQEMDYAYSCPDLWHVIASLAHIILFAGLLYYYAEHRKTEGYSQFLYYSKHITLYYALHLTVYLAAFGFHGYIAFGSGSCIILMLLSMAVTEVMVRIINHKKKTCAV